MAFLDSSDLPRPRQDVNHRPFARVSTPDVPRRRHLTRVPEFRPNAPRIPLWGVVVPTARATNISNGLALACRVATDWDAYELVIRSGDAAGQPFPRALIPTNGRGTAVIDLPPEAHRRLLPLWPCDRNDVSTRHRDSDVGLKRNVGLAAARMSGPGQALFFLDDDIMPLDSGQSVRSSGWADSLRVTDVLSDFAQSPDLQAVAWYAGDFPDNSAVFHARRLAGYAMSSFLSGGVLMVRTDGPAAVFAAAYNEDWFYMLQHMQNGSQVRPSSSVKYVGEVRQSVYDPFKADRACSEEVGDLIGEEFLAIAHRSPEQAFLLSTDQSFWCRAIDERIEMIKEVRERLVRGETVTAGPYRIDGQLLSTTVARAIDALDAARGVYGSNPHSWAPTITRFVRELDDAHSHFAEFLTGIAPCGPDDVLDLEAALDALSLTPYVTWYGRSSGRRQGPSHSPSGGRCAS